MEPFARAVDIEQVKRAELDLILDRTRQPPPTEPAVWGIALSGGGIRSATFALGVLQVLARSDLLRGFHYLSSISGGGYANAFVQGLIRRRGFDGAFDVLRSSVRDRAAQPATGEAVDPQQPILHLREYSNYLSPRTSPLSGDTLGMLGSYVRNVLLVQIQLCALLLALTLLPLLLYPWLQRGAARWPGLFLLVAGLLGVAAAMLLGWITTRANRVLQDTQPSVAGAAPNDRCAEEPARGTVAGAAVTDSKEAPPPFAARAAALAILATAVATLLGAAGLWGINARYGPTATGAGPEWSLFDGWASLDVGLGAAAAAFYFVAWMLWLGFDRTMAWRQRLGDDEDWRSPLMLHSARFVVSTAAAAALGGCALVAARHIVLSWPGYVGLWHAIIIGPTCLWAAVTFTGIVHLGLAGPALNDLQREVWARVGGRAAAAVILGIGLALAIAIHGPWMLTYGLSFAEAKWRAVGWIGVIAWIVTSGSGVLAAYSQKVGDVQSRARLLDRLARIAPWVFLLGLIVLIGYAGQCILAALGWDLAPNDAAQRVYLAHLAGGAVLHGGVLLIALAGALAIWLVFGFAMELNEFSMNAFYRNRLVRCYLGASNGERRPEPITNFDPQDDLVLAEVVEIERDEGRRPLYPLFGTALNMVAAKQLDWQDRKAASFCLTPGYCGYLPPPSHPNACPIGDKSAAIAGTFAARAEPTSDAGSASPKPSPRQMLPDPVAVTLTLGSAIAISGAAVSPNMGYHSSPAVTFLLTLFDARLGWWLPNPMQARRARSTLPPFSGGWLVAELLGLTRDGGRHLYLSDGGHFENLGIYELVRRGCRFIVCVDASADSERDFADLGDAVQKCRVDFGVDIRIDVDDLRVGANGLSARSCAVGTIAYADGREGVLLYLKPSVTGGEPTDVAHYARAHPSFPHEPTSDQYFDAAQFESYRRLGEYVATTAFASTLERTAAMAESVPQAALDVRDGPQKERFLIELRHAWAAPLDGAKNRFAAHADAMAQLFAKLRSTPALAVLDAQIYPSWIDLVPPIAEIHMPRSSTPLARRTDLPSRGDFRSCFYFCQELIQLMEAVYHDIGLEHAFDHPDHRGWMNMFRHWSWAPIFRVAWAVGAPTFGRRFVGFCELRLDMPRLNSAVGIAELARPPGVSWQAHCDALADDGRINHVERGILLSDAIAAGVDHAALRLVAMRMEWGSVLGRSAGDLPDSTVAIAVVEGRTLRLLRVQDHLRRMGLGAEFMRRLAARIDAVDVRAGSYGEGGIATPREAAEFKTYLEARRRQALAELRGAGAA